MIQLVCRPHPFSPIAYRVEPSPAPGQTLAELLGAGARANLHVCCDGETIPRERWAAFMPSDESQVIVTAVPDGVDTAVYIAALAYAAGVSGTIAGIGTAALIGIVGSALVSVGISMAVSMALNAIVAPQPPKPLAGSFSPSRFASISQASNRLARFEPLPRLYGTFRIHPPLAANYYSSTAGDAQYFNILLFLSYGRLRIGGFNVGGASDTRVDQASGLPANTIRIGETDIGNYKRVKWQIGRFDQLSLFERNVMEDGFSILLPLASTSGEGGWYPDGGTAIRTTAPNTTGIEIDLGFQSMISVGKDGKEQRVIVEFKLQYRVVGAGSWTTEKGAWQISGQTKQPVRRSYKFKATLAPNQYEVRITRVRTYVADREVLYADAYWTAMRSIKSEDASTLPWKLAKVCTMMALRIKATGQLNGMIDAVNVLAQSILPVWNGSAWADQPTNNPAWAYADALRGGQLTQPIPDSMIDLAGLQAWADACAAGGLEYNWYHQDAETLLDRIRAIATTGRASWALVDRRFSVVRDAPGTPVQLITPRNAMSLECTRTFLDLPHAVRVQYVDPAKWSQAERVVVDDGYAFDGKDAFGNASAAPEAGRFEEIQTQGVTSADQAWKEGRYFLAAARLRPETWTVRMDAENLVATRGDTVRLAYDTLAVGIAYGRIKSISGSPSVLVVDEICTMLAGHSYVIRIRKSDLSQAIATVTTNAGEQTTLALTTTLTGVAAGDLFAFGESSVESVEAIVKSIEYDEDLAATVTLVPAAPGIQAAYSGAIPAYDPAVTRPVELLRPAPPAIVDAAIRADLGAVDADGASSYSLAITWSVPAGDIPLGGYEIRWYDPFDLTDPDNEVAEHVTSVPGDLTSYAVPGIPPNTDIKVSVRSMSAWGRWSDWSAEQTVTGAGQKLPPDVDTLTLAYAHVLRPDGTVDTRLSFVWMADGTVLNRGYELLWKADDEADWRSVRMAPDAKAYSVDARQGRTYSAQIRTIGPSGLLGAWKVATPLAVPGYSTAPAAPTGVSAVGSWRTIRLAWTNPAAADLAGIEIWENTTNNSGTATLIASVTGSSYSRTGLLSGALRYYWLKAYNRSGNRSGFSAGVSATTTVETTAILDSLTGQITESQLSAALGGRITDVEDQVDVHATSIAGLSGQWTAKIDVEGYVTGFGLASEPVGGKPVSTFLARADRFAITNGTNPRNVIGAGALTRSGTTATLSWTSHGLVTGDRIEIRGATVQTGDASDDYPAGWNGVWKVTKVNNNVVTFTVPTQFATPATGAAMDWTKVVAPFVVLTATDPQGNPPGVYIDTGYIRQLGIDFAQISDTLQSANYNPSTHQGWRLAKDGTISAQGITIYDASGNVLLASGGANWSYMSNVPGNLAGLKGAESILNSEALAATGGNLLLRSEGFDHTAWTKYQAAVTPNTTMAPDGSITADTLGPNGSTGTVSRKIEQIYNSTQDGEFTFSVYAKKGTLSEGSGVGLLAGNHNGTINARANFNLTSGTTSMPAGEYAVSTEMQKLGTTDWYRCVLKLKTTAGTHNYIVCGIWLGGYLQTTENAGTIFIWGAQFERSPGPTPYIKTVSTPIVNRSDIANTNITLAANGALTGAGGGQVTIGGLGYTGDLNATVGAPAGTLVAGTDASTVAANAANGQTAFSGTSKYRTTGAPTNSPSPTGITLTNNSNGTLNIRLDWAAYTQGANQADFLMLFWRRDGSAPTINDGVLTINVNTAAASYYVFEGLHPADTYSFGLAAARRTENGLEIGTIQAPTSAPDWRGVTGGTPNYTANVGGQAAATVASVTVNFNGRNDRNGTAVVVPTILADGTAVDHTLNADGSADVSFEWGWSGTNADIDGFAIYVHQDASSSAYTFGTTPATEQMFFVDAAKRAFILYGVPANRYYTFGVRAYRVVDPDINAAGILQTSIVKPSLAAENPYRPSANVAFTGDVTGTVAGLAAADVNVWSAVTGTGKPADNATVGADFNTNLANIPYAQLYTTNAAVALGFNPTFSDWPGTYPTGWSVWSFASISKETTNVRVGRYAAKFTQASGSTGGLQKMVSWVDSPLTDLFVAGSVDIMVASYSSGGSPGILVDLMVNSGLTSYRRTIVPITDKTKTGVWQRVSFVAGALEGDTIYGIRIYVMASYPGMPGGEFVGSVIFDNFELSFQPKISAANASTYIKNLAVDTLQIAGGSVSLPESADLTPMSLVQMVSAGTWYDVGSIAVTNTDQQIKRSVVWGGTFGCAETAVSNAVVEVCLFVNGVAQPISVLLQRWPAAASSFNSYRVPISLSGAVVTDANTAYTISVKAKCNTALTNMPFIGPSSILVIAGKR